MDGDTQNTHSGVMFEINRKKWLLMIDWIKHRENRNLSTTEDIDSCLTKAQNELDSLRRQVIVDRMYSTNNSIHRLPIFREAVGKWW